MDTNPVFNNGFDSDVFIRFLSESLADRGVPVDERVREAVLEARGKIADLEVERLIRSARAKPQGTGRNLVAELEARDHSPSLAEFREMEAVDSNIFWRLESGDHQNLLDAAMEEIDELKAALRRVTPVRGRNGLTNAAALMHAAFTARHLRMPFETNGTELADWLQERALYCLNPDADMASLLTITSRREVDEMPYGTTIFTGDTRLAINMPPDPANRLHGPVWTDCLTGRRISNFAVPVRIIPGYRED